MTEEELQKENERSADGDVVREAIAAAVSYMIAESCSPGEAKQIEAEGEVWLAALSRLEASERENAILRGLTARLMPCRYCGVDDMAKCPRGFPGCGLGDDLLIGDEAMTLAWAEKLKTIGSISFSEGRNNAARFKDRDNRNRHAGFRHLLV